MEKTLFEKHTRQRLLEFIELATRKIGTTLSSEVIIEIPKQPPIQGLDASIAALIDHVYVDAQHIYPFVDLELYRLEGQRPVFNVSRSGYGPRPLIRMMDGALGPYTLAVKATLFKQV